MKRVILVAVVGAAAALAAPSAIADSSSTPVVTTPAPHAQGDCPFASAPAL